jgi:hypothetical protein
MASYGLESFEKTFYESYSSLEVGGKKTRIREGVKREGWKRDGPTGRREETPVQEEEEGLYLTSEMLEMHRKRYEFAEKKVISTNSSYKSLFFDIFFFRQLMNIHRHLPLTHPHPLILPNKNQTNGVLTKPII